MLFHLSAPVSEFNFLYSGFLSTTAGATSKHSTQSVCVCTNTVYSESTLSTCGLVTCFDWLPPRSNVNVVLDVMAFWCFCACLSVDVGMCGRVCVCAASQCVCVFWCSSASGSSRLEEVLHCFVIQAPGAQSTLTLP